MLKGSVCWGNKRVDNSLLYFKSSGMTEEPGGYGKREESLW